MLLGTLGASLLGSILTGTIAASQVAIAASQGQGTYRAGKGKWINRAGGRGGIVRAGYGRPLTSALHNN